MEGGHAGGEQEAVEGALDDGRVARVVQYNRDGGQGGPPDQPKHVSLQRLVGCSRGKQEEWEGERARVSE